MEAAQGIVDYLINGDPSGINPITFWAPDWEKSITVAYDSNGTTPFKTLKSMAKKALGGNLYGWERALAKPCTHKLEGTELVEIKPQGAQQ